MCIFINLGQTLTSLQLQKLVSFSSVEHSLLVMKSGNDRLVQMDSFTCTSVFSTRRAGGMDGTFLNLKRYTSHCEHTATKSLCPQGDSIRLRSSTVHYPEDCLDSSGQCCLPCLPRSFRPPLKFSVTCPKLACSVLKSSFAYE